MAREDVVIRTRGLSRSFGATVALDGLDLDMARGEVVALLGHNGAGKTTTVRLLNGILTPDRGEARVLGLSPVEEGPALRARTGVLTETPALDERLTAREILAIQAELFSVPSGEAKTRVGSLLEEFGLEGRSDEPVAGYSKGMKQRLALARTLVHRPELLFLDEPTAGLDPVAARHVHERIAGFGRSGGRTVLLCTHNLEEAQRLCHRVVVLERGRLVAAGSPGELARELGAGDRLEVEVAEGDGPALLNALHGQDGVAVVSHEGDRFTLAGVERGRVPGLVASLVRAGIRLYRVAPVEATLEDVYFALQARLAGGPGAAVGAGRDQNGRGRG